VAKLLTNVRKVVLFETRLEVQQAVIVIQNYESGCHLTCGVCQLDSKCTRVASLSVVWLYACSCPIEPRCKLFSESAFVSIRHQYRDYFVPMATVDAKIGVQRENLSVRLEFRQSHQAGIRE
jgi:hypothetical protein